MATLKNDLSLHNLTFEDAIEMALDNPLWGKLTASGATHWWCMPNNDDDDDVLTYMLLGTYYKKVPQSPSKRVSMNPLRGVDPQGPEINPQNMVRFIPWKVFLQAPAKNLPWDEPHQPTRTVWKIIVSCSVVFGAKPWLKIILECF